MLIQSTRIRPLRHPQEARLPGHVEDDDVIVSIAEAAGSAQAQRVLVRPADLSVGLTATRGDVSARVQPFVFDKFKGAGVALKMGTQTATLLGMPTDSALGTGFRVLQVSVSGADLSRKLTAEDVTGIEILAAGTKFAADMLTVIEGVVPQVGPYLVGARYVSVVIEGAQVFGLDRWAGQRFAELEFMA